LLPGRSPWRWTMGYLVRRRSLDLGTCSLVLETMSMSHDGPEFRGGLYISQGKGSRIASGDGPEMQFSYRSANRSLHTYTIGKNAARSQIGESNDTGLDGWDAPICTAPLHQYHDSQNAALSQTRSAQHRTLHRLVSYGILHVSSGVPGDRQAQRKLSHCRYA